MRGWLGTFGATLMALACTLGLAGAAGAADRPDCSRPFTLALHEHGLLYSAATGAGIDKDIADELARRSGCTVQVTLMPRARIWQLIESGGLDFSLSGITNAERDRFAAFAWYFSNKYYLLVRKDAGVRQLADFERQPQLQLGAIRSFRYSRTADAMVERLQKQGRVSHASGLAPLYEVLVLNRIQAMIVEPFDDPEVGSAQLRELTTILEFDDPPVPHGLIMSKKSLSAVEQQKWRALIDAMRADGTVLRIFRNYFAADLAAAMVNF